MEEHIFGFFRRDPMAIPVLDGIVSVPIKTGTSRERVVFAHILYISHIYQHCQAPYPRKAAFEWPKLAEYEVLLLDLILRHIPPAPKPVKSS